MVFAINLRKIKDNDKPVGLMSYDNKTEGSYCFGEGFRPENEASPVRVHLHRAKNKAGFADSISSG